MRFFAAEALAYLHDASGVDVLAETAERQAEYRAFALAALAAMDESAAALRLRELMGKADPAVRYGAFAALRALDTRDAFLGRMRVLRAEPAAEADEPDESDAMALRLYATPRHREPPPEDPFELYLVETDGPPLVHVARSRRCEVVVFGRRQKLLTPAVLGGSGPYLINAADGDKHIEISRIGADDDRRLVTSDSLGEVIQGLANLGASYPEVLGVLETASRQKNLEGPLIVDALPAPMSSYEQAQLAGRAKKDDAVGRAGLNAGTTARPGWLDRLRSSLRSKNP